MNIEEIKKNAPDEANHYRIFDGGVQYLKKLLHHDTWYIWFDFHDDWITTLWTKVEIGKDIKPLN